jgi:neurofibromin 1
MKRPASKPQSKRYTSETIADRDLLVLAILALFRIDARCFLYESETKELDDWVTDTVQLIQRPGDPAVPLSALRTFIHAANWVHGLDPGDEFYEKGRVWMSLVM